MGWVHDFIADQRGAFGTPVGHERGRAGAIRCNPPLPITSDAKKIDSPVPAKPTPPPAPDELRLPASVRAAWEASVEGAVSATASKPHATDAQRGRGICALLVRVRRLAEVELASCGDEYKAIADASFARAYRQLATPAAQRVAYALAAQLRAVVAPSAAAGAARSRA